MIVNTHSVGKPSLGAHPCPGLSRPCPAAQWDMETIDNTSVAAIFWLCPAKNAKTFSLFKKSNYWIQMV